MSYDIFIFDPSAAPRDEAEFLVWYDLIMRYEEPHDYSSPDVTTEPLRAFYEAIRGRFPPANGPHGVSDEDIDARVTDYSIGQQAMYLSFTWSMSEEAARVVQQIAQKTGVGVFMASDHSGEPAPIMWPKAR